MDETVKWARSVARPPVGLSESSEQLPWEAFLESNLRNFDSKYEVLFILNIFKSMPAVAVRPDDVSTQEAFRDAKGKVRRIDFAIKEPSGVLIAIEVDGYDKAGRGSGMTYAEFVDWLLRETSMVSQGWRVLRFANAQVRYRPDECQGLIEATILQARLEAKHEELQQMAQALAEASARQEAAHLRVSVLEKQVASSRDAGEAPRAELDSARREARNFDARLVELHEQQAVVGSGVAGYLEASEEARRLNDERVEALQGAVLDLEVKLEAAEKENRGMKRLGVLFAAVVALLALVVLVVAMRPSGGSDPCEGTIAWTDAKSCPAGSEVTVNGPVISVNETSERVYLNIGRDYEPGSSARGFVAYGELGVLPDAARYQGASVVVNGTLSFQQDGTPQVELTSSDHVRLAG